MIGTNDSAADKMDAIYRHQRFIYDLTRRHYLLGRDRLIAELGPPPGGSVLEIGCGTGRNLVQTAKRYPSARLAGLDVSSETLKAAAGNVAKHGLGRRIELAAANACTFDPLDLFGVPAFDRIFVSYVLSMIPEWPAVVDATVGRLSPNGALHIVDFGDFAGYPRAFKSAMWKWLNHFHVKPIGNFERRLAETAAAHNLKLHFEAPFRGYAAYAILRPYPGDVIAAC